MQEAAQIIKPEECYEPEIFIQTLDTREGFYGFLAQSYLTEPNLEFLSELGSQVDIIRKNPLYKEGVDLLHGFFQEADAQLQKEQEKLAREFVYLFVAPGAHRVHPYESVHRSKKRLFKQEPYDQVIQALRDCGLGKREECKELEDHIALEFEYMEILCGETILALANNEKEKVQELLERQRFFLVRHLLRWVPGFCKGVYKEARSHFYKGIALITDAFISSEKTEIDRLKKSLEYI